MLTGPLFSWSKLPSASLLLCYQSFLPVLGFEQIKRMHLVMTLVPSPSAEVGSMLAILPLSDNKGYSAFFRLYQTHILPQLLSWKLCMYRWLWSWPAQYFFEIHHLVAAILMKISLVLLIYEWGKRKTKYDTLTLQLPPLVYLYSTILIPLKLSLNDFFFKSQFNKEKHLSYNTDISLLRTFSLRNQFLISVEEEYSYLINWKKVWHIPKNFLSQNLLS